MKKLIIKFAIFLIKLCIDKNNNYIEYLNKEIKAAKKINNSSVQFEFFKVIFTIYYNLFYNTPIMDIFVEEQIINIVKKNPIVSIELNTIKEKEWNNITKRTILNDEITYIARHNRISNLYKILHNNNFKLIYINCFNFIISKTFIIDEETNNINYQESTIRVINNKNRFYVYDSNKKLIPINSIRLKNNIFLNPAINFKIIVTKFLYLDKNGNIYPIFVALLDNISPRVYDSGYIADYDIPLFGKDILKKIRLNLEKILTENDKWKELL